MTGQTSRPAARLRLDDIPFEETRPLEPPAPPISDLWSRHPDRKRASYLHWVRHPIDGWTNTAFHHLLALLPTEFVSGFGQKTTPLAQARYRNRIFAKRISRNLHALTAGRWTCAENRTAALSRWWSNIGRTTAEFSIVNRLWREGRIEVDGLHHLEAAWQSGRPIIFTSVHLATWEAVFVAIQEGLDSPSIGPFQPEPNRFTNRIVYKLRKRRNQYLFPPGQRSAYRLHRLLCGGQASMTIFIDEVRDNQVHVPLFGRPAPDKGNAIVAIKLANASNGTILPVYLSRINGARFKLTICPPIPREAKSYEHGPTLQRLNDVFEPVILANIEEWYMLGELRLPDGFEQGRHAGAPDERAGL